MKRKTKKDSFSRKKACWKKIFKFERKLLWRLVFLFLILTLFFFIFRIYKENQKIEIETGIAFENQEKIALEKKIKEMVKGYPIEQMVPFIVEKDTKVAAFLIGIAKKESNWGKRSPKKNGKDCFNYWGYRDPDNTEGSDNHSCFSSPKEAVDIVSKRIENLINQKKLNTPADMIIWKCGFSCKDHSQESVRKWINDVGFYFKKLIDF